MKEVESFEYEGVAKLLNDWFVSIKVDQLFEKPLLNFPEFGIGKAEGLPFTTPLAREFARDPNLHLVHFLALTPPVIHPDLDP